MIDLFLLIIFITAVVLIALTIVGWRLEAIVKFNAIHKSTKHASSKPFWRWR